MPKILEKIETTLFFCSLNIFFFTVTISYFSYLLHKYRISNEFSFHTMYYETSCVFYIPEPLARGYKAHNEFHNTSYGMKIHLRFFLSHELTRNEQITRCEIDFFRESGTDDAVAYYALIISSLCASLLIPEEDHISLKLK